MYWWCYKNRQSTAHLIIIYAHIQCTGVKTYWHTHSHRSNKDARSRSTRRWFCQIDSMLFLWLFAFDKLYINTCVKFAVFFTILHNVDGEEEKTHGEDVMRWWNMTREWKRFIMSCELSVIFSSSSFFPSLSVSWLNLYKMVVHCITFDMVCLDVKNEKKTHREILQSIFYCFSKYNVFPLQVFRLKFGAYCIYFMVFPLYVEIADKKWHLFGFWDCLRSRRQTGKMWKQSFFIFCSLSVCPIYSCSKELETVCVLKYRSRIADKMHLTTIYWLWRLFSFFLLCRVSEFRRIL